MEAAVVGFGRVVAKAGGGEGALGPPVVDVAEVPVNGVWSSVFVELVADVDEVLDGCEVDVVDGGHVEDDGFESRLVVCFFGLLAAARAGVVPWPIAEAVIAVGVCAACFGEDNFGELVEIVVCIWIVETFAESVDEDTRVGVLEFDKWIRAIVVIDGKEDVSHRVLALLRRLARAGFLLVFVIAVKQMITNNGVDLGSTHEATSGFKGAKEEQRCGNGDRRIDAIFNGREDRDEHSREENEDLERRYSPKLVDGVWWCDQVANGVDDNCRECRVRNIPEHCGKCVDGKQNDNSCDNTCERSSHAGFRFYGCARERTGGRISSKERT